MRGVEGAGAYRIGHPLGEENESPPFGFQIFLRNVAPTFRRPKSLMKLEKSRISARTPKGGAENILRRSEGLLVGPALGGRGRAASKRARKGADEKQNEEDDQQNLGDGRRQAREREKSQEGGHNGE